MHELNYDESIDRNQGVLAFISKLPETDVHGSTFDVQLPNHKELRLHPEVYDWVWCTLAAALPEDCRTVVYGHAALHHRPTGLLLAVAFGTHYILRVPRQVIEHLGGDGSNFARRIDKEQRVHLREAVGADWVFGKFVQEELGWCRTAYQLAAEQ
jgi:hypothetical protein